MTNKTSISNFFRFYWFNLFLFLLFANQFLSSPLNLNKSFRNKSHISHKLPFIYYILYLYRSDTHTHTHSYRVPPNKCKSPLNLTILERHADYWKRTQSQLLCRSIEQEPPLKKLNFHMAYHLYIWRWRPLNWFGRGCLEMSPSDW